MKTNITQSLFSNFIVTCKFIQIDADLSKLVKTHWSIRFCVTVQT